MTSSKQSQGKVADKAAGTSTSEPGTTDLPTFARLTGATIVAGILTGAIAACLNLMLESIEQWAFGDSEKHTANPVAHTPGIQLLLAMVISGILGAGIWYILYTKGRKQNSIPQAVKANPDERAMPIPETTTNFVLQVAQVAAGASVGRENAPRVAGALCASHLTRLFGIPQRDQSIIIAAAAGAGLAAAYHLPLAGALFALEVLAIGLTVRNVAIAMATSAIATITSSQLVHVGVQYPTPIIDGTWTNYITACLIGVVLGPLGLVFKKISKRAGNSAPKGVHILWQMPLGFALVGLLAMAIPEVLGNGKFAAHNIFETHMALGALALLVLAKLVAILISLRSGAIGGTLTPGFTMGVGIAALMWMGLHTLDPALTGHATLTTVAVLGAAAFLSSSNGSPFFALIVAAEFTGQGPAAYPALFMAVSAAVLSTHLAQKLYISST